MMARIVTVRAFDRNDFCGPPSTHHASIQIKVFTMAVASHNEHTNLNGHGHSDVAPTPAYRFRGEVPAPGRDADQGDPSPLMLGAERVARAIQKRIEIIDEQQIIGEQLGHEAFERARAFLQALDELASQRFFLSHRAVENSELSGPSGVPA
jgi:hypothetical protein